MGCAPAYACVRVPLETDHPKRYTQYVDMGVPPPPHSCHLPCLNKGDISFQACPEDGDAVHSGDTTREDVDRIGAASATRSLAPLYTPLVVVSDSKLQEQ